MPETAPIAPATTLVAASQACFPNESAAYREARATLLAEKIELRRYRAPAQLHAHGRAIVAQSLSSMSYPGSKQNTVPNRSSSRRNRRDSGSQVQT